MKVRGDFLGPPRSTDKTTLIIKVSKGANQEWIQSSTTPDPGYQWESNKLTADTTNESQEASPLPAQNNSDNQSK